MTDYLTALPTELLVYICELVDERTNKQYLGRVSKVFLPFSRNRVFGKLSIVGWRQLEGLAGLLQSSPDAGAYVKELTLSLWAEDTGAFKTKKPSTPSFPALAPPAPSRLLPRMKTLKLTTLFDGWPNPFDPAHYTNLSRYSSLNSFHLICNRQPTSLGRYRPSTTPLRLPGLKSWWLELSGYLASNPALPDFIAFFDCVDGLVITETSNAPNLSHLPLLEAIPFPPAFECLALELRHGHAIELSHTLTQFPRLRFIDFRRGSFHASLLPTLRSLPCLTTLSFNCGTHLSSTELKGMIDGADALPHLNKLFLEEYTLFADENKADPGFDAVGTTIEVIELAKQRGIRVSGLQVDWAQDVQLEREQRRRTADAAEKAAVVA
ncbi:hypothetical protein JCM10207_008243 [Rhodosporidiobolus poonsookiae]